MTSSTAANYVCKSLCKIGAYEEIEAEEQEGDNQAHLDLIAQQLIAITPKVQQIDDRSPLDSDQKGRSKNTHSSTHVAFDANVARKLQLGGEDNTTGNRSVNSRSCKGSDEIGTYGYDIQEVISREMISTVRARAYIEDMQDRKRSIKPEKHQLDATQIAESNNPRDLIDGNKRPALVCNFFAKGWCIKGELCKFVHIKDGLASKCKESVANAAQQKREPFLDSSLAENSALDDREILKQNYFRGLLNGDPGLHVFLDHERWPISSGGQKMPSLSTSWKRDPSQIQEYLGSHREYKTRVSGNWEPSIPFRPSHIITQRLLSRAKLCHPMHDSAEQTQIRDNVSQCGQDALGKSNNVYVKPHVRTAANLFPGYGSSTNFISGSNFCSNEIQRDRSNFQCLNAETTAAKQKSSLLTEKESSLNSTESRNIVEADMVDVNDSEPCTDRQSHATLPKIDGDEQDNCTNVDLKSDGSVRKDSNELKIFHAALVERVKELLRQPWHDGLLSKDDYKLIVKKTVDKVISTLKPHQIPATAESSQQYFLLFDGKLVKLVEAYIHKYGKSVHG